MKTAKFVQEQEKEKELSSLEKKIAEQGGVIPPEAAKTLEGGERRTKLLETVSKLSKAKDVEKDRLQDIKLGADLRAEFNKNPLVKDYNFIRTSNGKLVGALEHALSAGDEKSKAAADQVLVVAFNKMLDPTSVVRESEFARTAEGQSAFATLEGFLSRVKQGGTGLTDENRKDVVRVSQRLLQSSAKMYNEEFDNMSFLADVNEIPQEMVFGNKKRLDIENILTDIDKADGGVIEPKDQTGRGSEEKKLKRARQIASQNPTLSKQEILKMVNDEFVKPNPSIAR